MSLLAPFALWGLLALAIPVALHLRRRRVGRTVQVGSVRHLESLPTAERRGFRLREPWLLLLRSAIVGLLVLLLARPALERSVRAGGAVALVDSAAAPTLIDSLRAEATLLVERIDEPWRRVAELDDSLAPGVPLIVAASTNSEWFDGPRPVIARALSWIPVGVPRVRLSPVTRDPRPATPANALEARALAAATAAVAEEFGPLRDTTAWRERLPEWWRDSLTTTGFPVAVAHALLPVRSLPAPVPLSTAQLLPRRGPADRRGPGAAELHWWVWVLTVALFGLERFLAFRRSDRA